MKIVDIIVLAVVLGGVALLLYRTMWKPQTLCPGCDGCGPKKGPDDAMPCRGCHD